MLSSVTLSKLSWLIDWLIDWMIDWLIDRSIGWLKPMSSTKWTSDSRYLVNRWMPVFSWSLALIIIQFNSSRNGTRQLQNLTYYLIIQGHTVSRTVWYLFAPFIPYSPSQTGKSHHLGRLLQCQILTRPCIHRRNFLLEFQQGFVHPNLQYTSPGITVVNFARCTSQTPS